MDIDAGEHVGEATRIRGWRRISAASWGAPSDPQIHGELDLDAGPMLGHIEQVRESSGVRLTLTHLVGRALAHALAEHPDLNGHLRRGRFVRRDSVDVFFIVSAGGGTDLSGVKVEHADQRSAIEIAQRLGGDARRIKDGEDEALGKTKAMLERTPLWLLGPMLRLSAWLTVDLGLDLPRLGLHPHTFGSVMVSSVGMFGIRKAYAPLSPYYRVPLLVLVGEVEERPVAVQGEVVIRPMITLSATLDHRYLDGFHASRLARSVEAYCADPAAHEAQPTDPIEG